MTSDQVPDLAFEILTQALAASHIQARDAVLGFRAALIAVAANAMARAIAGMPGYAGGYDNHDDDVKLTIRLTERLRQTDEFLASVLGIKTEPGEWQALLHVVLTAARGEK